MHFVSITDELRTVFTKRGIGKGRCCRESGDEAGTEFHVERSLVPTRIEYGRIIDSVHTKLIGASKEIV